MKGQDEEPEETESDERLIYDSGTWSYVKVWRSGPSGYEF
jgi:hypothetical protein